MRIVHSDGYKWLVSNDDDHLALGGHETALGPILSGMADPERAFLNVGAHIGTWAVRLAKDVSCVYAVEANRVTAEKLNLNVELNDLGDDILIIVGAAWDENDVPLYLEDVKGMETGGSTRVEPLDANNPGPRGYEKVYSVRGYRLDSLHLAEPIGLVLIDVEGAEAHVLRGAENILRVDRPILVIELHEDHPGVDENLREQVYEVLERNGYSIQPLFVSPPEEHLLCRPLETLEDFPAERVASWG